MLGYPISRKIPIPKIKIPNPGDFPEKINPNPRDLGISYSGFFRAFLGIFGIFESRSRSPGFSGFSTRDFFRDFLGIFSGFSRDFSGFSNPDPDHRDFLDFRDFLLGIFSRFPRAFQIPIPIPGILGFIHLAQNKKSRSLIPGIRIRDSVSRKNPIPKPTLPATHHYSK